MLPATSFSFHIQTLDMKCFFLSWMFKMYATTKHEISKSLFNFIRIAYNINLIILINIDFGLLKEQFVILPNKHICCLAEIRWKHEYHFLACTVYKKLSPAAS